MDGLAAQLSKLRYDPSSMPRGRGGPKDALDPAPAGGDPANRSFPGGEPPPSIFNALQEQLGLKLEARKGPVDLLVIDHVQKTADAELMLSPDNRPYYPTSCTSAENPR